MIGLPKTMPHPLRYLALPVVLLLVALAPIPAHAGGWVQELYALYAKLTYGTYSGKTVYRCDGGKNNATYNPPFIVGDYPIAERSLFFYAEYGMTEDLTLVGSAALKRVIITSPVERKQVQGWGDIALGGRYRLATFDQHVISASAAVTIPTGYSRDLTPPLGSGNLSLEMAGNYGISLYPLPAYATATAGYRFRTAIFPSGLQNDGREFAPDYADEMFTDIEAGYTLGDRVLVHAVGRALFSTRTDNNDFDVEHPPETQRYIKVGGGVILRAYEGIALSVDAFVTPYGRKASNSFDLMLGLSWSGTLISN